MGVVIAFTALSFSLLLTQTMKEAVAEFFEKNFGLNIVMFGAGIIIALPTGAYIAQNFGWRATYHTATPLAVFLAMVIWIYVREGAYKTPRKIDYLGISLFGTAAASMLLAISKGPDWGWTSPRVITLFLLSVVAWAVFTLRQLTADEPFLPRDILNRNVVASTIAIMIVAYAFQMNSQNLTYLFQMPPPYGYGLTVLQTGLYMKWG